ncbi:hypothetical protein OsJ_04141 [Oryza sativa Japonica Group]|uniref:Serine aminopeptidase S33 domain-containing protein n=1 Tax=Oryza sativa subsp. japonica TaxID=39947 RepID=B9EUS9_ORYSJ|nr:hypothetical protein OsJ_04141 [Oryza sativa Japonica Group]
MVALSKLVLITAVALLGWAYKVARPPPPPILGGPGGPPVSSPRVQLKDGRHLAYREAGVGREIAKYKIIFSHGFASTKESDFPVSQELAEELGIYLLYFDRAGYGDSDANPKRGLKSDATDVEELADKLQLGEKFYVVGTSMGGYVAWSCLNYIPYRLAGVALVVPAVNYWWPMPASVSASAYRKLDVGDRRTFWIAHHMPWLFYAWFNQKWFRISPIVEGKPEAFTEKDWEILAEIQRTGQLDRGRATKQGAYHSLCRDATILFGAWEFDPTAIENPFPNGGRRRQHLARARGQDRAGGGAALRGGEAPVGTVPRAPRGRPPLHVRRRVGRQDRPGAPARRGAARFVDRSSSCPVSLHREGNTNSQIGEEYRSKRCL